MDGVLKTVLGWSAAVLPIAFGLYLLGFAAWTLLRPGPFEKRYPTRGGGLSGAFDSVFSPGSAEAGSERDRQTRRTAPAPAPGDPPWGIDGDRIRIDL